MCRRSPLEAEAARYASRDCRRDVPLQHENILHFALMLLRPHVSLAFDLDELGCDPEPISVRRTLASSRNWTPSSRPISFAPFDVCLYCKADVRAIPLVATAEGLPAGRSSLQ